MSNRRTYEELEKKVKELESVELKRKMTEDELAQIFSMSLDMICIADINTATFIKVNPAFTEILGYSEEDLLEKPFFDFIHPDDIDETLGIVDRKLQKGSKVINFENRYRCKDGTYRWLSWVSHPDMEKGATFAVARDITESKQNEEALKKSKELLDVTNRMARVGGWELDADTMEVTWTDETYRIHELPLDKNPPLQEAISFFHPTDIPKLEHAIKRALDSGEPYDMEIRFITAKGNHLWTRTICYPEVVEGKIVKLKGTFQDITKQKIAELALKENEERTRYLSEASMEAIFFTKDGFCIETNKAAAEMFGYKEPSELIGIFGTDIIAPESHEIVKSHMLMNKFDPYEAIGMRKNGQKFPISIRAKTMPYKKEGVVRVTSITDITENKKAEKALINSEKKWRNILVNTPQIGISLNTEAKITFANVHFLKLTGWEEGEVLGQDWFDIFIPEHIREEVRNVFLAVIKQKDTTGLSTYENVILTRHGSHLNVSWSNVLTKDTHGNIVDVTCLGVDLTERQRSENKLKNSKAKYQTILKSAIDGFWLTDIEGRLLEVNDSYCMMSGYSMDELLSMGISDLEAIEDFCDVNERIKNIIDKKTERFESKHRRKDGTIFDVEISIQYRTTEGGQFTCFLRDISEKKMSFEAIKATNEKMRLAANAAHFGVWDLNFNDNRLEWDDWMFRLYDIKPDIFNGSYEAWQACIHPDDLERNNKEVEQALRGEKEFDTEFRIVRPDGRVRHIKAHATVSRDSKGDPVQMTGINYDITDQKNSELNLKESEDRFKALHNASFGGIVIHDKGLIIECNRGLSEITGFAYNELIGMDGLSLISKNTRNTVIKNINSGYEKPYEAIGVRKGGGTYPLRLEARNIPYKGKMVRTVEFRDITEQKKAEQEREKLQDQLNQAQKMESVGRLAGGVAHDFNNMLSIILGNAEIIIEDIDPLNPLVANLEEIYKAAERSANLTRQLLAFARKQTIAPRILNLNHVIDDMLKMLKRLIGEDIDLTWQPSQNLWSVKIDPSQIDQILANLCVNARDAIKGVGKVTIETDNISFDEAYCKEHAGFNPGDYVMMAVSDNGSGMDKKVLDNLFEPFFTTKDLGQGTGLGLATVYGIVKQNNGFINVYSEPGEGTTFKIYLPIHSETVAPKQKDFKKTSLRGNETILLVEDEKAILRMTKMMLERLGYTVLTASAPNEAISIVEGSNINAIHLLMTDVVMPEMNGRDLSKKLLSIYPGLKCLFMSGYTANVVAHHGVLDTGVQFINKPFSTQDLATKVREVLDEERGSVHT